jgi:hypothetical protein
MASHATLNDGLTVADAFAAIEAALQAAGYHKAWADGWLRDADGAIVTTGYSYREVRVRRYLPGHKERAPQAIHNVRDYGDLALIDGFIGHPPEHWGDWNAYALRDEPVLYGSLDEAIPPPDVENGTGWGAVGL